MKDSLFYFVPSHQQAMLFIAEIAKSILDKPSESSVAPASQQLDARVRAAVLKQYGHLEEDDEYEFIVFICIHG